jgi:rRNA maturation protein Nop10
MSLQSKYNLSFCLWAISIFLWCVGYFYFSSAYGMLFLVPALLAGMYTMRMRCPACEKRFFNIPDWTGPIRPLFPLSDRCPHCDSDLGKSERSRTESMSPRE